MIRIIMSISVLLILFLFNSCSLLAPQEWSDNYALGDGVKSTTPEAIDGNPNTIGKMMFPDDFYTGRSLSLPKAEMMIAFPKKTSISRIVIHSDNLTDFEILANDMVSINDNWKLVKEVTNNKLKTVEVRTSIQTNKILVRAKGILPLESTETSRVLGGVVRSRKILEPEIREIEIYGFKSKQPEDQLWK